MKFYKTIVCIALIISLYAKGTKVIAEPLEIVNPTVLTVEEQIVYYSQMYNTDNGIISKIIQCESQGKQSAVGDNGLSRGIAQFQKPTFTSLSKLMGEELDYNSSNDQIKLMVWSIANGYGRNWTTYRALKNGGTYSFYSNQLGRYYTVYCKL